MRKIDEEKRNKIVQAVFDIVMEEGLGGLAFSKIAKRVKVSTATAYVYFENKEDMISKVYISVKQLFDEGLKDSIEQGTTMRERLFHCVFHFVRRFCEHPREANFVLALQDNPEYLSDEAIKVAEYYTKPMRELYEEALDQRLLKAQNVSEINAFLFAPILWLMKEYDQQKKPYTAEDFKPLVWVSVDSILNNR